jgi:hypothetical protein
MSLFSYEQKTRAKQQSVRGNQSNVDGLRQHGLIHQTPASGNRRLGRVNAREGAEETLRTMLAGLGDHIDAKRSGKARALSLDGKEQHLRPPSRANRLYE